MEVVIGHTNTSRSVYITGTSLSYNVKKAWQADLPNNLFKDYKKSFNPKWKPLKSKGQTNEEFTFLKSVFLFKLQTLLIIKCLKALSMKKDDRQGFQLVTTLLRRIRILALLF